MRKRSLLLALSLLVLPLARAAVGGDFTLNVPVDVKDLMPSVTKVGVLCQLYDAAGQPVIPPSQVPPYNSPLVAPDHRGNYKGTLTVKIHTDPVLGTKPSKYRCALLLALPGGFSDNIHNLDNPYSNQNDALKSKPGTIFVPFVEGTFPK